MALQVWLPLNGNLNNQGLSTVSTGVSSATVNSNGKIGNCYACKTGSYLSFNYNITTTNTFSIAFWLKLPSSMNNPGSWQTLLSLSVNDGGTDKTTTISWTDYNNIKIWDTSNHQSCWMASEYDVWNHYVITNTFNSSVNNIKVYKNGKLVGSYDKTVELKIRSGSITLASGVSANVGPVYYNDVRIYDHCLSPKEVHSISQALILHYKLDDMYSETTTNLGNTSTTYSNQTEGNAYTASSWGGDAGTVTYYKSGGYNNGPYKVYHKTATGTGGIFRKTANDITIVEGKTYTMSIYVKASRDYTDSTYSFNINGVTSSDSNHYITASSSVHFTTEWTRIERTFTASANDAGTYGEMSIIYNDNVTDYYVYFSCFQIEEKDHATPFVIGTRNGTIFDDSGYQNDGNITGNLQIKNNSPRYRYCAQFADSATSIGIGNLSTLLPEGVFTFNIWFKKITDEWSSKTWETIFGGPSGFELETKNGSTNSPIIKLYNWGGGTTSYSLDQWNMITFCRNSSETKLYLNGELKITGSSGSVPSGNYFIGAWNSITQQNYRGYLSDARLYATTLSEFDVKSLYNVGAVIDNGANMHTYEYHEIESTTPKVHRTGVTDSSGLVEQNDEMLTEYSGNILSSSNLTGHGSSWTLQSETYKGLPIYKNVVTSPNVGNNAGFRLISSFSPAGLSTATKVTISFYKRLNVVYGKNFGGYIRVVKSDSTTATYYWSYNKSNWANDSTSIGKWEFINATVTIPTGCTSIQYVYVYVDNATGGDCDFSKIQLEFNSQPTVETDITNASFSNQGIIKARHFYEV